MTEISAEDAIRANIAAIADAVNTMDLDRYGSQVTDDFVNMNRSLDGELTSTVGRQARLDILKTLFEISPFAVKATMVPLDVHAVGDRGFAQVDGTLRLTPKRDGEASGYTLKLDLYLFFCNVEGRGWLSERSMGIEKSRADD